MKRPPVLSRRIILSILILALASQACAISLFEWPFPSNVTTLPPTPSGPAATPAPRARVTFTVRLPEPLLAGESLLISVLDEVTGLSLNHVDYQLTPIDAVAYTTNLDIPDQSVIRYRYVRQSGGARVNEDTNLDEAIRYRLFYVNGNTQIIDTVSSWADKPVNTLSGNIFGMVINSDTGAPIPDIMVTAGGAISQTDSAGRFQLIGLRAGTHNVVAYALDGAFSTFQQGADVADNQTTPVQISLKPAPLVNVTFIASVPPTTDAFAEVRLAGNLLQLGNTFSDQRGGLSTIADRMPRLSRMPDGRYSVSLFLPAGADVQYKYTLGDGFWNAEFTSDSRYVTRRILVPAQNTTIEDVVQSWQSGPDAPIVFEVTVPSNTPAGDVVYIQFNPYGWTPPIPMWKRDTYRWAYKLYGPLNIVGAFGYRYCRNAQCDSADDAQTVGPNSRGRSVSSSIVPQNLIETINEWAWPLNSGSPPLVAATIPSRGTGFMAGVEYQSFHDPSVGAFNITALQNIQGLGANWVVYTPSWTFRRTNPVIFSEVPGRDPFWVETVTAVSQARALNINTAIFPQPRFAVDANDFWKNAPRDGNWWSNWFDQYRAFAIHFADQATFSGAQALIIGGDWITPALPSGLLVDGTPSGVPADAETRWRNLIGEIRQHFRGNLIFALPYNSTTIVAPVNVLRDVDAVYLLWFAPLTTTIPPNKGDMINEAGRLLDQNVAPVQIQVNKPFIIGLSYPSSTNSATGCIPNGNGGCLDWSALNRPNADLATVNLDLQQQADIYEAVFNALNNRTWVSGLVSRGYFAPVELQDKSASIHGKPADDLLWYWFPRLLGNIK
ncbi:MAG TPA: hypothetical protein VMJ90_06635 [Anaerolineales bacterium]|nr:hypothetical protein [Anaerolineales bacterium]